MTPTEYTHFIVEGYNPVPYTQMAGTRQKLSPSFRVLLRSLDMLQIKEAFTTSPTVNWMLKERGRLGPSTGSPLILVKGLSEPQEWGLPGDPHWYLNYTKVQSNRVASANRLPDGSVLYMECIEKAPKS